MSSKIENGILSQLTYHENQALGIDILVQNTYSRMKESKLINKTHATTSDLDNLFFMFMILGVL